jgi:hypothetical protein
MKQEIIKILKEIENTNKLYNIKVLSQEWYEIKADKIIALFKNQYNTQFNREASELPTESITVNDNKDWKIY